MVYRYTNDKQKECMYTTFYLEFTSLYYNFGSKIAIFYQKVRNKRAKVSKNYPIIKKKSLVRISRSL
jgi:hypothetical protein